MVNLAIRINGGDLRLLLELFKATRLFCLSVDLLKMFSIFRKWTIPSESTGPLYPLAIVLNDML